MPQHMSILAQSIEKSSQSPCGSIIFNRVTGEIKNSLVGFWMGMPRAVMVCSSVTNFTFPLIQYQIACAICLSPLTPCCRQPFNASLQAQRMVGSLKLWRAMLRIWEMVSAVLTSSLRGLVRRSEICTVLGHKGGQSFLRPVWRISLPLYKVGQMVSGSAPGFRDVR